MTRLFAAFGLAVCLVFAAGIARAEERITSFHANIALSRDGGMRVAETIDAVSAGNRIKRGLYRDIPLTFVDGEGRTHEVDFNVVSVKRDDESEPWHSESIANGIRIFTGDADVFLSDGPHRFEITYETARQIRFFNDYDELNWNVTGNGWEFPIEEASATVTLPEGVRPQALDVFTGVRGSRDRNARAVETGSDIVFTTTRSLRVSEGLTILVKLPKGAIAPPSLAREKLWWLKDNLAPILAIAGFIIVAAYYGRMWLKVGRDPPRGVIVPRWDVPDKMSPALVNYIDNKGFSGQGWTALSAAALSLAVGGFVTLQDLKSALVITATGKARPASLPTGEAALMKAIDREGGTLTIDTAHGEAVKKAGEEFRAAMETEHRGKFYQANTLYVVGGVLLSVLFLGAIAIFGNLHEAAGEIIVVPVLGSIFVAIFANGIGRSFRRKASLASRIFGMLSLAVFGFILVSGLSGAMLLLAATAIDTQQLPLLLAVGGILLVNLLFFFLMGAPTPLGTRMMDAIDGLRQYLTLAEADRMNMAGAPVMSPQHFETLLPYAVALGVEKPWSQTFQHWLASAAVTTATASAYQPLWYAGHGGSFSDRIGEIGGSLADTMSASLPAPPSSSSSGFSSGSSGFGSGGGGGGGGGGGW